MKTLRELREERGLTQLDVAKKCDGIMPSQIGAIELNKISLTKNMAEKLAPLFDMTPEELIINHHGGIVKQGVASKNGGYKEKVNYLLDVADDENTPIELRIAVLKGLRELFEVKPQPKGKKRDMFGRQRDTQSVERDSFGRARPKKDGN